MNEKLGFRNRFYHLKYTCSVFDHPFKAHIIRLYNLFTDAKSTVARETKQCLIHALYSKHHYRGKDYWTRIITLVVQG